MSAALTYLACACAQVVELLRCSMPSLGNSAVQESGNSPQHRIHVVLLRIENSCGCFTQWANKKSHT